MNTLLLTDGDRLDAAIVRANGIQKAGEAVDALRGMEGGGEGDGIPALGEMTARPYVALLAVEVTAVVETAMGSASSTSDPSLMDFRAIAALNLPFPRLRRHLESVRYGTMDEKTYERMESDGAVRRDVVEGFERNKVRR